MNDLPTGLGFYKRGRERERVRVRKMIEINCQKETKRNQLRKVSEFGALFRMKRSKVMAPCFSASRFPDVVAVFSRSLSPSLAGGESHIFPVDFAHTTNTIMSSIQSFLGARASLIAAYGETLGNPRE